MNDDSIELAEWIRENRVNRARETLAAIGISPAPPLPPCLPSRNRSMTESSTAPNHIGSQSSQSGPHPAITHRQRTYTRIRRSSTQFRLDAPRPDR